MTRLTTGSCAAALLVLAGLPAGADAFDCPVTRPDDWPNPSVPMGLGDSHAWYGSNLLAAAIPRTGTWHGMGKAANYRNKFWWWREGFSGADEPKPDLEITALRLDGEHQRFVVRDATNGSGINGDWSAMLVGMEFPSDGCWELRGRYNQREELVIVVHVRDRPAADEVRFTDRRLP